MSRPRVIVFARAPERGQVKTRLAATLGDDAALALYTRLGARVIASLAHHIARRFDVVVAFTPAHREADVRAWAPDADAYVPQCEGDLTAKLSHATREAFEGGAAAVVLVGTDCLAVDGARVDLALDALDGCDAALGAAHDGGYYLLAMARKLSLFEGVPWSTDAVAEATRARLRAARATWAELPVERDLDTADDLAALHPLFVRAGVV